MNNLISVIQEHQKQIGKFPLPVADRISYIKDLILALNMETAEFLNELPWKPWKPILGQPNSTSKAADELVDMFIFLLDMWLALGSCRDLDQAIKNKIECNIARLNAGVHKQHK